MTSTIMKRLNRLETEAALKAAGPDELQKVILATSEDEAEAIKAEMVASGKALATDAFHTILLVGPDPQESAVTYENHA